MADPWSSEYVTLVSCDGFEFIIPRSAACISGTIRRMLDPSSTWIEDCHCGMSSLLTTSCAIGKFSEALTGRCVLETLTYVFSCGYVPLLCFVPLPGLVLIPVSPSAVASSSRKSVNTSFTTKSTRTRSMSQIWISHQSCAWSS